MDITLLLCISKTVHESLQHLVLCFSSRKTFLSAFLPSFLIIFLERGCKNGWGIRIWNWGQVNNQQQGWAISTSELLCNTFLPSDSKSLHFEVEKNESCIFSALYKKQIKIQISMIVQSLRCPHYIILHYPHPTYYSPCSLFKIIYNIWSLKIFQPNLIEFRQGSLYACNVSQLHLQKL